MTTLLQRNRQVKHFLKEIDKLALSLPSLVLLSKLTPCRWKIHQWRCLGVVLFFGASQSFSGQFNPKSEKIPMRIQRLALLTEPIRLHTGVVPGEPRIEILVHLLYDSIKAKWYTRLKQSRQAPILDGH